MLGNERFSALATNLIAHDHAFPLKPILLSLRFCCRFFLLCRFGLSLGSR